MRTDSSILSPLQDTQEETLEGHLMPTARRTTCQPAAVVREAAAPAAWLELMDPEGSIHSRGPAVKVWAGRPLKTQHMLHGQLSRQCWASSGQQEAELAARTAAGRKP